MLIEVTKNVGKPRRYKVDVNTFTIIFCDSIKKDKFDYLNLYNGEHIISVIYIAKNKIKVTNKKDK